MLSSEDRFISMLRAVHLDHDYTGPEDETLTRGSLPTDYKTLADRLRASRGRAARFFGKWAPLDLSVSTINHYGIVAMLQSNVPLMYFLRYLLDNYAAENLFLFVEIENYDSVPKEQRRERRQCLSRITDMFIIQGAVLQVNLAEGVSRDRLASARSECLQALTHHYNSFKRSEQYQVVVSSIGDLHRSLYTQEQRHRAADQVLTCLEAPLEANTDKFLRQLAKVFVERRLNVRFEQLKEFSAIDDRATLFSEGPAADIDGSDPSLRPSLLSRSADTAAGGVSEVKKARDVVDQLFRDFSTA